ncbi:MAG: hypothetical protein HOC77_05370 [Chloroflexi bacterium]|jgi:hypothetical protein|nr:hypothetical protein [Chloroflexota bacterium]MBT4072566.1 hypothetical protein [Chloroflexota bacterium]MBT4514505.1 hypothetical protein [Chloroflexota bacterium]MBT6681299.1 hypothetical protein [Chloroflexota bacterium]
MTQEHDQPEPSLWELYLERKVIEAAAAERAQETHRERREQEADDDRDSEEAKLERAEDLAYTREVREAELEFERMERERRGIDAGTERRALAKERHAAAAVAREADLLRLEADRVDAIATAALQAAETLQEHAEEFATSTDVNGAQYKALVETKVETAARMQEYRSERETEQSKIEEERRGAASLMAQQARETRLLRELEGGSQPVVPAVDRSEIRALAALLGNPKSKPKSAVEVPSPTAMDELEEELEIAREREVIPAPVAEKADCESQSPVGPQGFIRKLIRGIISAA